MARSHAIQIGSHGIRNAINGIHYRAYFSPNITGVYQNPFQISFLQLVSFTYIVTLQYLVDLTKSHV